MELFYGSKRTNNDGMYVYNINAFRSVHEIALWGHLGKPIFYSSVHDLSGNISPCSMDLYYLDANDATHIFCG